MRYTIYSILTILLLFCLTSCDEAPPSKVSDTKTKVRVDENKSETPKKDQEVKVVEEAFRLTDENAIEFFFNYQKELKETKVKLETSFGDIVIELFDNVPYHKANFIYLAKQGYFDNTYFHRVVKNFIIQGGNADTQEVATKRTKIGRYLLPPDTRKGHKHHRGVISMPSSDIGNPYKLASPYEFFIVVTKPGSYHLDGGYTPFGKVISGMDVVDEINRQPVDNGDWPMKNILIKKATAF